MAQYHLIASPKITPKQNKMVKFNENRRSTDRRGHRPDLDCSVFPKHKVSENNPANRIAATRPALHISKTAKLQLKRS
jgi:hypothetical protein